VDFQYLNKKLVATSFPSSKEAAITIAAALDPENNIAMPTMEKYAAQAAIKNDVKATNRLNVKCFILYQYNY
jgi:hypothetical protein